MTKPSELDCLISKPTAESERERERDLHDYQLVSIPKDFQ